MKQFIVTVVYVEKGETETFLTRWIDDDIFKVIESIKNSTFEDVEVISFAVMKDQKSEMKRCIQTEILGLKKS